MSNLSRISTDLIEIFVWPHAGDKLSSEPYNVQVYGVNGHELDHCYSKLDWYGVKCTGYEPLPKSLVT